MTKRQANLIIALLCAVIGLQVLFTGVLLRGQERTRKSAESAEAASVDALEVAKRDRPVRDEMSH